MKRMVIMDKGSLLGPWVAHFTNVLCSLHAPYRTVRLLETGCPAEGLSEGGQWLVVPSPDGLAGSGGSPPVLWPLALSPRSQLPVRKDGGFQLRSLSPSVTAAFHAKRRFSSKAVAADSAHSNDAGVGWSGGSAASPGFS
jgi:hypothetical protein